MAVRPTQQQRQQVETLISAMEGQMEAAFRAAFDAARNTVDMAALLDALNAGNIDLAVQMLRVDQSLLYPLQEAMRQTYIGGGMSIAATLPKAIQGRFGFNGRHWRAEQWVQSVGGDLIQGIQADTLEMARSAITSGLTEGRGAQAIARDITGKLVGGRRVGGFLGLTAQQTDSIIAGRAKLLSGDPALMREYLTLKQRNRTFDPAIQRAIANGERLSAADVDKIIEAQRQRPWASGAGPSRRMRHSRRKRRAGKKECGRFLSGMISSNGIFR